LTEPELCDIVGINYCSWDSIKRGLRKPSHYLMIEFAKVLGDEVILLFLGSYIDEETPVFITADKLENDPVIKKMQENIKKVHNEGKEFRYL
jgi:hypothetical protein